MPHSFRRRVSKRLFVRRENKSSTFLAPRYGGVGLCWHRTRVLTRRRTVLIYTCGCTPTVNRDTTVILPEAIVFHFFFIRLDIIWPNRRIRTRVSYSVLQKKNTKYPSILGRVKSSQTTTRRIICRYNIDEHAPECRPKTVPFFLFDSIKYYRTRESELGLSDYFFSRNNR